MPLDTRPRLRNRRPLSSKLFLGLAASLAAASVSQAASGSWLGAADSAWSNASNWSASPVPGAGEIATFAGAGNANTTIDLGAGVTIGSVVFDTASAAAYTIGTGGAGGQTLTLGTAGNTITINSTVTANQLFNSNLALSVTRAVGNVATYYAATNNSATNTLTLAGGISASTAGVKVLNVTGAGNTAISGAIASGSGNMSLFKTGAGTLTLSGGATFSGNGITDGANFASSAVFREGTTVLNGGTYGNSGGEFVIGGVATHGGAGTNTTLQLDNGAVLNNISWLSIGRGNGNGTATTNLTLNGASSVTSVHLSAGYHAGNVGNVPKGAITLNGTSSINVAGPNGEFHLGESGGSNFTMTLNDSASVTLTGDSGLENRRYIGGNNGGTNGGTGVLTLNGSSTFTDQGAARAFNVGYQNGNGTVTINSGTTFTTGAEIRVAASRDNGTFTGSGTINVNGGTLNMAALTLARNNNDVASTLNATVNVTSGIVNVKTGQSLVGWRGTASSGTINVSGGSFNQGTTSTANMTIGTGAGATGAVNVSGTGTLTFQNNSNLRFSDAANANASRTLTISGGNVTFYSDAGSSVGGTGVIDLMLASNPTGTSTINLDGGTLTANQIKATSATGTRVINFNGGTLKAGSGNATLNAAFLANGVASSVNVRDGGAIIDTNGSDVTITQPFTHSAIGGDNATDGGLTKLGGGTLTITGVNTYTGDTAINGGRLALADNASLKFVVGATGVSNKVAGSGSFTVDGDFVFDLAGAGTTVGDSWQIVDVSTLTETFGATFTIPGFTANGAKWFRPENDTFYEFDPATGVLSVINDPDITYPPPTATAGNYGTAYSIGSDIILSATASGIGEITYQWYYQADAEATPVAIEGATGPTLTVSGATGAASGIYSLVVTDHAAEASGKPATTTTIVFSTITVQPANDLAVSYHRFEDGTNGSSISPALDSVGGNNLTLLGAATYANTAVPYGTVPATTASNSFGAKLAESGVNGLVASTNGTLAATEFTDFTIEAFVRFSDLTGSQTIVGRDDSFVAGSGSLTAGQGLGGQALFYLAKNAGGFRVELITKDNLNLQINSTSNPAIGAWYHVAAVGKAGTGTLKLYVNGVEVGSVTGYNGLFVPAAGTDTPWTVGRGDFNLTDVDFLRGDIDEVRITRAALLPSQFLNSADGVTFVHPTVSVSPSSTAVHPGANVVFTATASPNMSGTLSYQWYKDGVALDGETGTTLSLSSVAFESDGVYSVVVTDSAGAPLGSPVATTVLARLVVLDVPSAGACAIGLNFVGAGSGAYSTQLGTLSASQSAGIYAMTNWNNSASVTGVAIQETPILLMESTGSTAAAVTGTWNSTGAWSARTGTGLVTQKTPDALLLHGYIESRTTAGSTVSVSNIPYASYDVYVHVAGGGNGEVGSLKIDREGSPTYYYRVLQHDSYVPTVTPTVEAPYSVPFVIGEAPTRTDALAAAPATFVRFTGVTGSDLTITAIDETLNKNSGGIASVQIVDRSSAGAVYPPLVTSGPVSKLAQGGSNPKFTVVAVSQNSGALSYQWKKDGVDLPGATGATLNLSNVTGASSGNYSVTVTDTSGLGTASVTRTASLVVVDSGRSLLINGDINIATSPTYVGDAILHADGTESASNVSETNPTVWNGVLGASGAATRLLTKESTGLNLAGVTFSYSGANGAEDNTLGGGGVADPASELERDYLFANADSTTPLVGTISGLQALAGKQVRLLVYAVGKTAKAGAAVNSALVNDVANVTLAPANNYLASSAGQTTVLGVGSTEDPGRNIEFNNPYYYGSEVYPGAGYVSFTGVVDSNGTVSWDLTPVATEAGGGGLAPLVGFQLLVTHVDIAPPVPTGLNATVGTGQVSLSWTASIGAGSYTVKRATSEAGPYTTIYTDVSGTSLTDNTVTGGTTYYYTVAAKNSLAQSADSEPLPVATPSNLSKLQSWRQTHFATTDDSGEAANTADPDGDGIPNLLEYALATDPNAPGAPAVTVGRSGGVLTLSFNHTDDDTLIYMIEASNDLLSWSPEFTYPAFTSAGEETYTDDVSLDAQARRFLRLVVTNP